MARERCVVTLACYKSCMVGFRKVNRRHYCRRPQPNAPDLVYVAEDPDPAFS
jgi:hypothetical protein